MFLCLLYLVTRLYMFEKTLYVIYFIGDILFSGFLCKLG